MSTIVKWNTLKIELDPTQPYAEKEITLDKGERIVAAAISTGKNGVVDLGLYENGVQVSVPMDLDFWKRSNAGSYLDGFKPIEYKGGSALLVRLSAPTDVIPEGVSAVELEAQGLRFKTIKCEIAFGIIKENQSC